MRKEVVHKGRNLHVERFPAFTAVVAQEGDLLRSELSLIVPVHNPVAGMYT